MRNDLPLQTEVALMYDAVHLFAKALSELTVAQQFETVPLSCNKKQTWQYGNSLLNYMKSVRLYVCLNIFISRILTCTYVNNKDDTYIAITYMYRL